MTSNPNLSEVSEGLRPCRFLWEAAEVELHLHKCVRDHRHNPPHRCACRGELPPSSDERSAQ